MLDQTTARPAADHKLARLRQCHVAGCRHGRGVDDTTGGAFRPPQVPAWALTIAPGKIDRRIVHQAFWIDSNAQIHQIPDMDTEHIRGALLMLGDLVLWLYREELLEQLVLSCIAAEDGLPGQDELVAELGGVTILQTDPITWLETTALVRALRRELRQRQGA
ncbi:MAG TPA: hypothetical protein VIH37_10445 [Candidatus Limnocylindrales bacterium]